MGYEDVKLNLKSPKKCDLQIGQILYYEKDFVIHNVEIVSIDCQLEDTIKLVCKEDGTCFEFSAYKNSVFGENNFTTHLKEPNPNVKTIVEFYRTQKGLAEKLIPRIVSKIEIWQNKLTLLKSMLND